MLSSRFTRYLPQGRHCRHIQKRCFTILGLESSRDSACAAVVSSDGTILSNVVEKRQLETVKADLVLFPLVQISHQQRCIPKLIRKALDDAKLNISAIDAIAYTQGPGIGGCLSVGAASAKVLGVTLDKPIIGIHHLQAHALAIHIPSLYNPDAPSLTQTDRIFLPSPPRFPYLSLIATSTHTLLAVVFSPDNFRILSGSSDISIGAAYDAVAQTLGLRPDVSYGGTLDAFCALGGDARVHEDTAIEPNVRDEVATPEIPAGLTGALPMSFKDGPRAVAQFVRESDGIQRVGRGTRLALANAFQDAVAEQVGEKVVLALRKCEETKMDVKDVVMCGGVASNIFLRSRLSTQLQEAFPQSPPRLICPPPWLCTDNAAMVAWAGMHRFEQKNFDSYEVSTRPNWKLEDYSGRAMVRRQWLQLQAAQKRSPFKRESNADPGQGMWSSAYNDHRNE